MKKDDVLVHEDATYDNLAELTKEVRSVLEGRVAPGAGIVLAYTALKEGRNIIAAYTGSGDDLSSTCSLNDMYQVDVDMEVCNVWKTIKLETEPPVIRLSDMWPYFKLNEYLSNDNRDKIIKGSVTGRDVSLNPVRLWRGREGQNFLRVRITPRPVREALELVFLVHVWSFMYNLDARREWGSHLVCTTDVNRPAITGLDSVVDFVGNNDMSSADVLYSAIVSRLREQDVTTSDWRINKELGFEPWDW